MTQYEKLSLALLSQIATGIGFQLTALNPDFHKAAQAQSDQILEWQKGLLGLLENVKESIDRGVHE